MLTREEYLAVRKELAWLFTAEEMATLEHGAPTIVKLFRERDHDRRPFVIHVSEMDAHPGAVYIGRANPRQKLRKSKWHNPFKITDHVDRADVLDGFADYIQRGSGVYLQNDLHELTGKPLACWCRHSHEDRTNDNTCHGDILVELWNERFGDATD